MNDAEMRPPTEPVYWIGVDVSKATFDATLVKPGQRYPSTPLREMPAACFERSPKGVEAFLQWMGTLLKEVPEPHVRVVMEATGKYSITLAQWMNAQCPMLAPAIVNPRQAADFIRSLGLRNTTDQLAARGLALYGAERSPQAHCALAPEYAELQSLSRYRDALVRERTAERNRAEQSSASKLVNTVHRLRLKQLDKALERIEAEMRAVVRRHPELAHDVDLLSSIYGVAFLTAALILAELGDLKRFRRARQLSAFAGLNPRMVQSGSSVRKRPRLSKQGNARVRQALYLAAMVAIHGGNEFGRTYQRLIENGKTPMQALGAIMRKMLTVMRAILISGKPYNALYKTSGEADEIAPQLA